ncbi:TIR domain-containing protein [Thioclava sp. JE_KL1]|uniref:TIR domain-containing protein n=1 Tax=Thioclava sp. JE_KL1 TaxID=2651187 RepID=UPI00128BC93D|nr:TIR domain-containing protein [Thioclava sp. JE_KL1]MPQ93229.1 nuclease [Thioclava sp. JE_KL1]
MPKYHVFISHAWSYSDRYTGVINLLNIAKTKVKNFDYVDYSVPEHDPAVDPNTEVGERKLTALLQAQIARASSVIVPAGMYVNNRFWIQKEIDLAKHGFNYPKRLIAIRRRGQQRTPQDLIEIADQVVSWSSTSLARAVADIPE